MDEECTADGEEINLVLMKLVSFMSFGHCILPQPSFFVDEMMESMSTSAGNFTFESMFIICSYQRCYDEFRLLKGEKILIEEAS